MEADTLSSRVHCCQEIRLFFLGQTEDIVQYTGVPQGTVVLLLFLTSRKAQIVGHIQPSKRIFGHFVALFSIFGVSSTQQNLHIFNVEKAEV